jgi:hypothetical protein
LGLLHLADVSGRQIASEINTRVHYAFPTDDGARIQDCVAAYLAMLPQKSSEFDQICLYFLIPHMHRDWA